MNQYLGGEIKGTTTKKKRKKETWKNKRGGKVTDKSGGIHRSGDAKRDVKNICGSHRRGKTKKLDETAGIKHRYVRVYDQVWRKKGKAIQKVVQKQ